MLEWLDHNRNIHASSTFGVASTRVAGYHSINLHSIANGIQRE